MNILLPWTHEDIKLNFLTKDCNCCKVAESLCNHEFTRSKISFTLSGVTHVFSVEKNADENHSSIWRTCFFLRHLDTARTD